jgi:hypothetical protein
MFILKNIWIIFEEFYNFYIKSSWPSWSIEENWFTLLSKTASKIAQEDKVGDFKNWRSLKKYFENDGGKEVKK